MSNRNQKNRVGLCLAFQGKNYGMLLQAFATQYVVDSLGYNTEIINYISTRRKKLPFSPWIPIFLLKNLMARLLLNKSPNIKEFYTEIHQRNEQERRSSADKFRGKSLHDIRTVTGINNLFEVGGEYKAVIVGSDQQWLPDVSFTNFRTLRFVPNNIVKISYATSMGVTKYPFYCKYSASKFLKRIDYLSVREENAKSIIQSITDIPVKVVLDPTYLISASEWKRLFPEEEVISKPYILCYFLGNYKENKLSAQRFAKEKGLRMISILSDESTSSIDLSFADEIIIGASPEKFVNLVRNAAFVFTDSFHGIAFSIINSRQFFAFIRNGTNKRNNRNSRIENVLRLFSLTERLIYRADFAVESVEDIDYAKVHKVLDTLREDSMRFLTCALEAPHNEQY